MDPVLGTTAFQDTLAAIARETGRPLAEVQAEAEADLKEMAVRPGRLSVAAWDRFCRWLSRAYHVDYRPAEVVALRELNARSALVFLPNHRSYLDPLVLRSALLQHGFPPNNVLGGANLRVWPMSELGQRNGIVFIRREFRDDAVYRAVLKRYLAHLIETRSNLEWYVEGGRTRTGKLRAPRFGVLSYVVDAFADYPEHDVHIVPTSIIYDQQHEVSAISAEEMGGRKKPESIGWLYRFAKEQSRHLGRAHVRFGTPLSLRDALSLTLDDDGTPRPRLAVPRVALEVMQRIDAVTPVTPSALVTYALLDNGDRAITAEEGLTILEPLVAYVQRRGLPVTGGIDLSRHGAMRDALHQLVTEGVVTRFDGPTTRLFTIELEHQHEAAFYRNTIVQHFVARAIAELALLQAAEEAVDAAGAGAGERADIRAATWRNARRLKELLKFEFSFPTTRQFAADIERESSIVHPGWEQGPFTAEDALEVLRHADLVLAHRVVGPFLEAYGVLADELAAADPTAALEEAAFVDRCLGIARERWLLRRLHSAEAISRDYFRNAFQLAANQGLVEPGPEDLAARRGAFAEELRSAVRRVADLRRIAQAAPRTTDRTVAAEGAIRG